MEKSFVIIYDNGGLKFESASESEVEEFKTRGNGAWEAMIIIIVSKSEFLDALGHLF